MYDCGDSFTGKVNESEKLKTVRRCGEKLKVMEYPYFNYKRMFLRFHF